MAVTTQLKWTFIGIIVGLGFLWLSLRGIDVESVASNLMSINPMPAILVVIAAILFMLIKAWRWAVILKPVASVDLSLLHSAAYIGTAANLIIVHSGEVIRAALIGRKTTIAPSAVLASIGVERVFDFMVVVALFGVLLMIDPQLPEYVAAAGVVAVLLVVIGLLVVISLVIPSKTRGQLARIVTRLLPEKFSDLLIKQLKRSLIGFSALGSPLIVIQTFLLSIIQWSCIIAAVWLSGVAVDYMATLSMAITVWILMVVGLTLPSSPAQLGTIQLAFILGLSFTLDETQVPFAASVVYTVCVNLPYMIIGAVCWLRSGGISMPSGNVQS